MRRSLALALVLFVSPIFCPAQHTDYDFPQRMVFARHTYFDFGPPSDFYEVLQVTGDRGETHVERVLVTPPGDACLQPATIETKAAVLHQSTKELLSAKDPCSIPEKSLKKELKRCKHCINFSGENITLNLSCGPVKRRIRMDILDRDLFDKTPNTPMNTSWTMAVLAKLDQALGPGVWDKPAFSLEESPAKSVLASSAILQELQNGDFDDLFDSKKRLSEYYRDSQTFHYPPAVETISSKPPVPIGAALPVYPPIAKAAHVEGEAKAHFVVSDAGAVMVSSVDGPELFKSSVKETVSKWTFSAATTQQQGEVTFRFRLNCSSPKPVN